MDAETIVVTILALVLGAPVIIIFIAGAVVVVGLAVLVVTSIGIVREAAIAVRGYGGGGFRISDVKLVVVDPKVKVGEDAFFFFTWSIANDNRDTIGYEEQLVIQEAAGERKPGTTSLAVLSDPISATRAWREPGLKAITGSVTFTLSDGTAVTAAASGAVRVVV